MLGDLDVDEGVVDEVTRCIRLVSWQSISLRRVPHLDHFVSRVRNSSCGVGVGGAVGAGVGVGVSLGLLGSLLSVNSRSVLC